MNPSQISFIQYSETNVQIASEIFLTPVIIYEKRARENKIDQSFT